MDIKKHAEMLFPLFQAFAEGKTIQWYNLSDEWQDTNTSNLSLENMTRHPESYRIKPELKEIWVLYGNTGSIKNVSETPLRHGPGEVVIRFKEG